MQNYSLTIALVGRPNVGKSTLFNRIIGGKQAIVDDFPGVTRDYKEAHTQLTEDVELKVIDTAGLDQNDDQLAMEMTAQTLSIINNVDLILFIIDGQVGITTSDIEFARQIRKFSIKTLVIVNKLESHKYQYNLHESYKLGFDEVIPISASHGDNMLELYRLMLNYCYDKQLFVDEDQDLKAELQLAIIGRPNVGKSTLMNAFIGYNRALIANKPGTTRDSIGHKFKYKEKQIKLIDTAGMRKKANIKDSLEKMAISETMHAVKFAQIVIVLLDARQALEKQDLFIIEQVIREGRAIILGINKIDLLTAAQLKKLKEEINYQLTKKVHYVKQVPLVYLSAKNKNNIYPLLDKAIKIIPKWSLRIATHKLNEWLQMAINENPIPLAGDGKMVKIKYITQHKTRPPTFILFVNRPEELKQHYVQYLQNSLANSFDLSQIPIRIILRKQKNPYIK